MKRSSKSKNQSPLSQKALSFAQKLSREPHLRAICDSFLFTIPFLVLSGFMVFIAWVLLAEGTFVTKALPASVVTAIQTICSKAINGGQNILSLMMVFLTSYNLAKNKKHHNPVMPAIISVGALFILQPGALSYNQIGTKGLFVAFLTALLVTELFLALSKVEKLKLKVSGKVPPAITESFNTMFVIIIIELLVALIAWGCEAATGKGVYELMNTILQKPLVGVATKLPTFLLYFGFGQCFGYFLGIHPAGWINPIVDPPLMVAIEENNAAWLAGEEIPHIISLPFRDVYGTLGGIASTLGLLLAILLVCKRKDLRDVAKLALPTSIFNINEPVLFGVPIVFNPIMFIPFCFTTSVLYTLAYFATSIGLISKLVVYTTWSTPIFFSGYMASGGDWRNVIFQVFLLFVAFLCYLPFAKILDKQKVEAVADDEVLTEEDLNF